MLRVVKEDDGPGSQLGCHVVPSWYTLDLASRQALERRPTCAACRLGQ